MKVLLIEDDEAIANLLNHSLTTQHYLVEVAVDGEEGWGLAEAFEYDLILLDLMLPKLDGISFCQRLRHEGYYRSQSPNRNTPILLMTGADASSHRVAGLDAGADDYIVKPFDLDELLARVRALLRRGNVERSPLLSWGLLKIDPSACQASYKDQSFHLSSKEYSLLELFLRHPQQIFSHGTLVEHLWALEMTPTENAVRAQIKGLRKKLKAVGAGDCIETVYGLGYRLKEEKDIGDEENRKIREREETSAAVAASALSSSASPSAHTQHQQQISTFWEQYRSQYCDRLSVMEEAISALQTNALTTELWEQARREAHTLKGSLGLFGLDEASDLSQELEQLFKIDHLNPQQQKRLSDLASSLRQILEQPSSKATPSVEGVSFSISPQKLVLPRRSQLLIVDDDAQLLNTVKAMLQPWGFQIALLDDPQGFWGTLEAVKPDLLLLDIEMLGVNGIDLCQVIRNDSRWEDLPILMISASTDDETVQQVFMAGADDYVRKPIRAAELVARVIRRLEHATVLKKLRGLEN